ncbi:hypothetical protein [Frateuria terrea]|uniref:Uncharacterized protein n=1 Tax=Frateuria terrea TaxID=529704 RepID=A0A1H6QIW6_9GAMM|nr:hypothetical protein [Frateuria terrea]SEI39195.1 hypothetical protein SAMN04487997_0399 [Frateuria terrea]SFP04670.1 hypothetical protein SAMN02927913_0314 [Frateuria terrea]
MKALVFALAMAIPGAAAATVAMESQLVTQSSGDATQARQAERSAPRQLFIVKYELRRPPPEQAPRIVMDDTKPQIVPPAAGSYPNTTLGAGQNDPNVIVCFGWGCESRQR